MKTSLRAGFVSLLLLGALPARPDVFSPGELSRPHQSLEGLQNCTKCHVAGKQLAPERCLDCHGELKGRVAQGKGFHGRMAPADRNCQTCHHEHQGRDFPEIDWGKGGEKGFDHAKTGFDLKGKHRKTDCARCHDPRLIADAGVKEVLARQPTRKTYLGAPPACAACHFDEHRGQIANGADCARCHGEDAWKPAGRFDHAKTAYRLDGKHVKVQCAKCHASEQEAQARTAPPGVVGPVRPAVFERFKPVPFEGCADCHKKDPHQGRFGPSCKTCHVTSDWKKITGLGAQQAFHEKTRYPLRGLHVQVKCDACHGPWPGVPAKYKGLAFARCADCHADSHLGQLARAAPAAPSGKAPAAAPPPGACERCHTVDGWIPARFEVDDHQKLEYRLEGAHRTVACAACHPRDPRLATKVPVTIKADLERKRRPLKLSLALLRIPKASDCRTCHRDPHAGQLDARVKGEGCAACHGQESWRKLRFDHAKDSRYPLTGKHEKAACASCHRPDAGGVVRYRPLGQACAACHADIHAGQFAAKGQGTDCARCHETAGWKEPLRFRHEKPFTSYTLDGKHRKLECAKCHLTVQVAGAAVRRYRPLPTACEGCHADFHKGAFRGYVP
ncbi:MAG TPA: cytochrome c3 family protein [Anaeromyxobacter sp.]|nr:cytochrome c3 family protein [Anaeromyxobacter sp.]